jgi:hypothetical protein
MFPVMVKVITIFNAEQNGHPVLKGANVARLMKYRILHMDGCSADSDLSQCVLKKSGLLKLPL